MTEIVILKGERRTELVNSSKVWCGDERGGGGWGVFSLERQVEEWERGWGVGGLAFARRPVLGAECIVPSRGLWRIAKAVWQTLSGTQPSPRGHGVPPA